MEREGINEKILQKTMRLQDRAIDKIVLSLKGEKPFAQERIDPQLKIWAVENLGFQDMTDVINEFGIDKVNQLVYEAKMLQKEKK